MNKVILDEEDYSGESYPVLLIDDTVVSEESTYSSEKIEQIKSCIDRNLEKKTELKHKDINDINISFGAGAIGTRGAQIFFDYEDEINFENIVSIEITYIKESSQILPMAFRTPSHMYINVYRATADAVLDNSLSLRICYEKLT